MCSVERITPSSTKQPREQSVLYIRVYEDMLLNYCFSTDIAVIILTPDQSVRIAAMCVCTGDS